MGLYMIFWLLSCALFQSGHSLPGLVHNKQSMDIDEDSDQNLDL